MRRALAAAVCVSLAVLGVAACPTAPIPVGNLSVPGALSASYDSSIDGGYVIFVTEGDGQDVKAFVVGDHATTNPSTGYVRGPNAINARSIFLGLELNGVQLPSFRANRVAGGHVIEPLPDGGFSNTQLGYAIVAGAGSCAAPNNQCSTRLAMVEARTFEVTLSTEDQAACAEGLPSVSCLPEPAIDVVVPEALDENDGVAYALLAPDSNGIQSFITLAISVATDNTDPGRQVPVLTMTSGPIPLPAGTYARMAVWRGVNGPAGDVLYFGNVLAPEVVAVQVSNPTQATTLQATQTELAGTGVRVPVLSPEMNPANGLSFALLAVLTDGRILTLDPGAAATHPTTATAVDADGAPLNPMSFGVPAQDISFVPCPVVPTSTTCNSSSRIITVGTGTGTGQFSFPAYVALGDGTGALISSDMNGSPQIFRAANISSVACPTFSTPGTIATPNGTAEATSTLTIPPLAGNNGPATMALGYTQTETVTVTFHGELPILAGRSATLSTSNGELLLTDTAGTGFESPGSTFNPMTLTQTFLECPASGTGPCLNDLVHITSVEGTDCSPSIVGEELRIQRLLGNGQAILEAPAGTCLLPGADAGMPLPRIAYDVLAADGDFQSGSSCSGFTSTLTCGPWVVTGSETGFKGRAVTSTDPNNPQPFQFVGNQFYYQCDTRNCTAPFPTNVCASAAQSFALAFTINGLDPCEADGGIAVPGCNGDGDNFTFTTSSSFVPLLVSSTATASGLASGIVATPQWLYMTSVGANAITEIGIETFDQSGSVNVYQ
jgi:hypothetical protein